MAPVSAHMLCNIFETTRITDANRSLLEEPDIAVSETLAAGIEFPESPDLLMDDLEKVSEVTDGIILEIENGAFLPDTISVIRLSSDKSRSSWTIPELLTANGFTTIFRKEDGAGWYLQKGETLNLCCRIGKTAGTDQSNPAERMEIGYIKDHVFCQGKAFVETDFSYTLTAPETGIYYLYCINCSAGKIYIKEGNIE